jgi:hypothetical protein
MWSGEQCKGYRSHDPLLTGRAAIDEFHLRQPEPRMGTGACL